MRVNNDVEFFAQSEPVILSDETKPLLSIIREKDKFYVHNDTLNMLDQEQ